MTDAHSAPRTVGVVVVAAGSGSRLGAAVPKAFVHLAGEPIIQRALAGVRSVARVMRIALVVPPEYVAVLAADQDGHVPAARVVAGGAERTDSVAAGLAALGSDIDFVLVHDAARCLTPVAVFDRVIDALQAGAAAVIPGVPVVDTIKTVGPTGLVTGTPERGGLRAVQTPQGFTREALAAAYRRGGSATDDAALAEACGIPVRVVDGDARAFKITGPEDLARAERLLAADAEP